DRGTAAVATTSASMICSIVMGLRATDRRSASKCRENGQIRPSTKRSGAGSAQEGRENANIDAGLGFIWRISVSPILSADHCGRGLRYTKGLVCLPLRGWGGNCVLLPERCQAGQAETCFLFSPIGCHAGPLPIIIAK